MATQTRKSQRFTRSPVEPPKPTPAAKPATRPFTRSSSAGATGTKRRRVIIPTSDHDEDDDDNSNDDVDNDSESSMGPPRQRQRIASMTAKVDVVIRGGGTLPSTPPKCKSPFPHVAAAAARGSPIRRGRGGGTGSRGRGTPVRPVADKPAKVFQIASHVLVCMRVLGGMIERDPAFRRAGVDEEHVAGICDVVMQTASELDSIRARLRRPNCPPTPVPEPSPPAPVETEKMSAPLLPPPPPPPPPRPAFAQPVQPRRPSIAQAYAALRPHSSVLPVRFQRRQRQEQQDNGMLSTTTAATTLNRILASESTRSALVERMMRPALSRERSESLPQLLDNADDTPSVPAEPLNGVAAAVETCDLKPLQESDDLEKILFPSSPEVLLPPPLDDLDSFFALTTSRLPSVEIPDRTAIDSASPLPSDVVVIGGGIPISRSPSPSPSPSFSLPAMTLQGTTAAQPNPTMAGNDYALSSPPPAVASSAPPPPETTNPAESATVQVESPRDPTRTIFSRPPRTHPDDATYYDLLKAQYAINPYPSSAIREEIRRLTGKSDRKILCWFNHQRRIHRDKIRTLGLDTTRGRSRLIPIPIALANEWEEHFVNFEFREMFADYDDIDLASTNADMDTRSEQTRNGAATGSPAPPPPPPRLRPKPQPIASMARVHRPKLTIVSAAAAASSASPAPTISTRVTAPPPRPQMVPHPTGPVFPYPQQMMQPPHGMFPSMYGAFGAGPHGMFGMPPVPQQQQMQAMQSMQYAQYAQSMQSMQYAQYAQSMQYAQAMQHAQQVMHAPPPGWPAGVPPPPQCIHSQQHHPTVSASGMGMVTGMQARSALAAAQQQQQQQRTDSSRDLLLPTPSSLGSINRPEAADPMTLLLTSNSYLT
ncbi:hypothetical protein BC828DRAFT_394790 [Blastocladiella britannica]|nr:hypothetical protein BC828DRAFT_394790 [Blastocladiella britannica]